jgi:hypothetical protein
MSKEQASILRQAAEILRDRGFPGHIHFLETEADKLDRPIDRNLRGWVLVTDYEGDQFVRWATDIGTAEYKGAFENNTWDELKRMGWTVGPFPTGYTIADIETVLNEIFTEEWAKTTDDELLWPGIGHVVTRLRRLRREA